MLSPDEQATSTKAVSNRVEIRTQRLVFKIGFLQIKSFSTLGPPLTNDVPKQLLVRCDDYWIERPPSTSRHTPVRKEASSEAR